MTNYDSAEIVRSYKQAADKTEQVIILAELTCSDIDTNIEILKDAGAINQGDIRKRICCKCGKEYITTTFRGVPVCGDCQEVTRERSKAEYRLKKIVAQMQDKTRELGRLKKQSDKLREKINNLKGVQDDGDERQSER